MKKISSLRPLLLVVALVDAGTLVEPAWAESPLALELSPCQQPAVDGEALCGRLTVPENRSIEGGRQIELNLVVLPAVDQPRAPEPILFLHGGPGGAATDLIAMFAGSRPWKDRDLVFVDQRGTGGSNPLRCDPDDFAGAMNMILTFRMEGLEDCRQQLDADLTQYTTTIAIEDLEVVREALGAEQVNLWGGSYGTRVALEYVRRYPQSVRAMILVGVGGTNLNVPLHFARSSQIALDEVLADCAEDAACARSFPDLEGTYQEVLASLDHEPVMVAVTDPLSGHEEPLEMTQQIFSSIVHYLLYSQRTAGWIPSVIRAASAGEFAPAIQISSALVTEFSRIHIGMLLSVICSEDAPFFTRDDARLLADNTVLGPALAVNMLEACSVWPRGEIPADYRLPVRSDVPAVLISGSADPVTPYYLAMQVSEDLENSLHLVVNDGGHWDFTLGCIPALLEQFLAEGSIRGLNPECGAEVERSPFQGTQ